MLLGPALAAVAPGATPRAAMREFLTACRASDYEEAARYLDLRLIPPSRRAAEGPALARRLKAVLDRTLWVELDALSDAPEGELEDGLPRDREQVGVISSAAGDPVPLLLQRRSGAPQQPAWRITRETLSAVPALSEELQLDWLEERLPPVWVETRFLELELWQWVALPALVALAALFAWIAGFVLGRVGGALARRTRAIYDDRLVAACVGPLRLLLGVLALVAGRRFLALAVPHGLAETGRDFCRFGDRVGTVEEVGMRSTRVRTLDRTVVTIPNAEFAVLPLENFTQRDRIWFHARLGLRYETTADQLRDVLARLRELLRADPRVDPDPARVRFIEFGAHSLDLELFAYVRTRDFDEFLAIREDLLLQIMDCVAACGSAFAFPSQTVYATQDPGLPRASRAVSAELA